MGCLSHGQYTKGYVLLNPIRHHPAMNSKQKLIMGHLICRWTPSELSSPMKSTFLTVRDNLHWTNTIKMHNLLQTSRSKIGLFSNHSVDFLFKCLVPCKLSLKSAIAHDDAHSAISTLFHPIDLCLINVTLITIQYISS